MRGLIKYWFLNPPFAGDQPVFLFLSTEIYPRLMPWHQAARDGKGETWIPYVESWYPDDVELRYIDSVLTVSVVRSIGGYEAVVREGLQNSCDETT